MPRLLLTLRYDGTRYHGWQVQPNGVTVQQVMQDAVERLTGVRSGLTGCSRTDAGVHANMFCCTLDTACPLRGDKLAAALNAHLPADVAVYGCREVPADFHPRYMAAGKRYVYVSGTPPPAIPSGRATPCIGSAGWTSAAWTRPPRLTAARMILRPSALRAARWRIGCAPCGAAASRVRATS